MAELKLSIIDSFKGKPVEGAEIEIQTLADGTWRHIGQYVSDISGSAVVVSDSSGSDISGYFEVTIAMGAYFLENGYVLPTLKFIDIVPIRFGIDETSDITKIVVSFTPSGYSLTTG